MMIVCQRVALMNIFVLVRSRAAVPPMMTPSSSVAPTRSSIGSARGLLLLAVAICLVASTMTVTAQFPGYKGTIILTTGTREKYYKDQAHIAVNPNTGEWKYLATASDLFDGTLSLPLMHTPHTTPPPQTQRKHGNMNIISHVIDVCVKPMLRRTPICCFRSRSRQK
jgi:hypothetical protein